MTAAATQRNPNPSLITQAFERLPSAEVLTNADPKKPHRVRFNEDVCVRRCLHINNYTRQERNNCWYRRSEMSSTKNEIRHTIQLWKEGHQQLPETMTFRGLEQKTRERSIQRRYIKLNALLAVLEEQRRQRGSGADCDDEKISELYREKTQKNQRMAIEMGKNDEIEAGNIQNEPITSLKKTPVHSVSVCRGEDLMISNARVKKVLRMIRRR